MPINKYRRIEIHGKKVREHRLVWEAVHGPIPAGFELHHINGKHRDNRIENLQLVTRKEHMKLHGNNVVEEVGGQLVKKCRTCEIEKPVKDFRIHQGIPYFRCRKCCSLHEKEPNRLRYLKRKRSTKLTPLRKSSHNEP